MNEKQQEEQFPEPLPLIEGVLAQDEPQVRRIRAYRRKEVVPDSVPEVECKHRQIHNHTCAGCGRKFPRFDTVLDTLQYAVAPPRFNTLLKYVSEIAELNQVIYESYTPRDMYEMREYILFLICKQIQRTPPLYGVPLGTGEMHDLSPSLREYLARREANRKQAREKYGNGVLEFDSTFESGNLDRVQFCTDAEYKLYMKVDTNTRGHQQWFYFRVKNTRKGKKYRFHIMNFTKPWCLYR